MYLHLQGEVFLNFFTLNWPYSILNLNIIYPWPYEAHPANLTNIKIVDTFKDWLISPYATSGALGLYVRAICVEEGMALAERSTQELVGTYLSPPPLFSMLASQMMKILTRQN